jgi:hypothetical protein
VISGAEPLDKADTVAKLLGHAEQLAASGAFRGSPAAYAVYAYLCMHPADTFRAFKDPANQKDYRNVLGCKVDVEAAHPDQIRRITGIRDPYRVMRVLRDRKLISGGRGGNGPLMLASVNRRTEGMRQARLISTESKRAHGTGAAEPDSIGAVSNSQNTVEQLQNSTESINRLLSRNRKRQIVRDD